MVVSKDDRGRAIRDYIRKDIARMNEALIQQANRDDAPFNHLIGTVNTDANKVLLSLANNVRQQRHNIAWRSCFVKSTIRSSRITYTGVPVLAPSSRAR